MADTVEGIQKSLCPFPIPVAPPKSGVNSVLRPPTALYTSGALGLLRGQELKQRRLP